MTSGFAALGDCAAALDALAPRAGAAAEVGVISSPAATNPMMYGSIFISSRSYSESENDVREEESFVPAGIAAQDFKRQQAVD
jgi:hypothetical protein